MGVLFALFIAIFINYSSLERIFDSTKEYDYKTLSTVIFSLVWFCIVSMFYYLLYALIFNQFYNKNHSIRMLIFVLFGSLLVSYALLELYPLARNSIIVHEKPIRRPVVRMINEQRVSSTLYKYTLISLLNLLFVYIQRLLFRNQEIERRNEQLQLESIRSQHSALIQQVNPHFFFNSLGSLRYIIQKGEMDKAVDFLDNLTTIFRKTLKLSSNSLHSLSNELEVTESYIHIIESRFDGKIFVKFNIEPHYKEFLLSPLSLLTLIENVVKHNKVSSKSPINIEVFTPERECAIVVKNNIVKKFEQVDSNGIGLINLNKQYELLLGKGITVTSDDCHFSVKVPLIKRDEI